MSDNAYFTIYAPVMWCGNRSPALLRILELYVGLFPGT
jgi:hypothetical protein